MRFVSLLRRRSWAPQRFVGVVYFCLTFDRGGHSTTPPSLIIQHGILECEYAPKRVQIYETVLHYSYTQPYYTTFG